MGPVGHMEARRRFGCLLPAPMTWYPRQDNVLIIVYSVGVPHSRVAVFLLAETLIFAISSSVPTFARCYLRVFGMNVNARNGAQSDA